MCGETIAKVTKARPSGSTQQNDLLMNTGTSLTCHVNMMHNTCITWTALGLGLLRRLRRQSTVTAVSLKLQNVRNSIEINRIGHVVQHNIQARSRNHWCRWKSISITYFECVSVALVIQHAKRMRRIIMWPVRFYHIFPHYLLNGTIFGETLLNIKHVLWFSLQLLSETFLILRRFQRHIITNVHSSSCKVPDILVIF
jgi:hypothetical protein